MVFCVATNQLLASCLSRTKHDTTDESDDTEYQPQEAPNFCVGTASDRQGSELDHNFTFSDINFRFDGVLFRNIT